MERFQHIYFNLGEIIAALKIIKVGHQVPIQDNNHKYVHFICAIKQTFSSYFE